MKKAILILGSLAVSLLIILIPILLTCSILFLCNFGIEISEDKYIVVCDNCNNNHDKDNPDHYKVAPKVIKLDKYTWVIITDAAQLGISPNNAATKYLNIFLPNSILVNAVSPI